VGPTPRFTDLLVVRVIGMEDWFLFLLCGWGYFFVFPSGDLAKNLFASPPPAFKPYLRFSPSAANYYYLSPLGFPKLSVDLLFLRRFWPWLGCFRWYDAAWGGGLAVPRALRGTSSPHATFLVLTKRWTGHRLICATYFEGPCSCSAPPNWLCMKDSFSLEKEGLAPKG
jgi:hypothetical protein